MPKAPLPAELEEFVARTRKAVVSTIRPDGSPVTAAVWYEWLGDGRFLLSMEATGARIRNLRHDPRVGLTVLGDDWYTHVSLLGRTVEVRDDPDLVDIDRMSMRYLGVPYEYRDLALLSAVVAVERWHSYGDPSRPDA